MPTENHQTPTEILISALEEFGRSEPVAVAVVFTSEDGSISYRGNVRTSHLVGMLEVAKHNLLRATESPVTESE